MATQILTQDQLKNLLDYAPDTGKFTWRVNRKGGAKAGDDAGRFDGKGYRQIQIDGRLYAMHRLAWLYVYGVWPGNEIDHINRDKTDNRICNLRQADRSLNTRNTRLRRDSTTGAKGVCWSKQTQKWVSRINIKGKRKHIGFYDSLADAVQARKIAEIILGWP